MCMLITARTDVYLKVLLQGCGQNFVIVACRFLDNLSIFCQFSNFNISPVS